MYRNINVYGPLMRKPVLVTVFSILGFLDGTPKGTVYSHVHFEKSYNNWLPDYKQYDRVKLGTKNREGFFYTHNKKVVPIIRQYNCFSKTLVNQDI